MSDESCRIDACDARGAAQELAVARVAHQQGDVKHAAFHVAAALFDDPTSTEAKAMAVALDHEQPGVFEPNGFAGQVAAAAHVAFARGDVETALAFTAQVAQVLPDLPWETWLHEQIARAVATHVDVPTVHLGRLGLGLGKHTIGLLRLGPGEQRAFARYADVLFAATAAQNGGDALLCSAASSLARRAGQLERAIALAERAHQSDPKSGNPLVMKALALRAAGKTDEAAATFARAAALDGNDGSYVADRARCFFDAGRVQEAFDLLETLPDKDSDIELRLTRAFALARGAVPAAKKAEKPGFLAALRNRGAKTAAAPVDVAALAALAADAGGFLGPADGVSCDSIRHLVLSHGMRFGVAEATVNVIGQMPRPEKPSDVAVTVTTMEAPSSRLALALHVGKSCAAKIEVTNNRVPEPDPRTVDDDGYSVWKFHETTPYPALPDPPAAVHAAVDAVSGDSEVWLPTWRARAAATCTGLDIDALCAAFVNLPIPPHGVDVVEALLRRQLAVACALSVTEAGRARLLAILGGPVDWVSLAAASALVEAVVDDEVDAGVVGRRLRRLAERVHDGHCCLTVGLSALVARVPFARPDTLHKLAPSTESAEN